MDVDDAKPNRMATKIKQSRRHSFMPSALVTSKLLKQGKPRMWLRPTVVLVRKVLTLMVVATAGATLALITVFVIYLNDREDLSIWHEAELDEEFTIDSPVTTFDEYLELEARTFKQLDELVYANITPSQQHQINRYSKDSLSDPSIREPNWNRSYQMTNPSPTAGVLMIHGMSDSPYSLRAMAQSLHSAGANVVGLRVPGHGTTPSGLLAVTWQDMAAAVRLAVRHLAVQTKGKPLYIVGYSNGGALAVNYELETLQDDSLPAVDRLVIISPEIGLPRVAAYAVWQARLGRLLGLDKLAWNSLLPEYDPYKYGSFAVNAGDVAYRLTTEIQSKITTLTASKKIEGLSPILAFSSIVDATVSVPALLDGLFNRLPPGDHELVLFNINLHSGIQSLLKWSPSQLVKALRRNPNRNYVLGLVTNQSTASEKMIFQTLQPGSEITTDVDLNLSWPTDVYSLTHVALPFPPDDPVYGGEESLKSSGIQLGQTALRGERGALRIPASDLLRLRWNPFYDFLEDRALAFLSMKPVTEETLEH